MGGDSARDMSLGTSFREETSFSMFGLLARIERRDRAVIAHHARPYFARLSFMRLQLKRRGIGFDAVNLDNGCEWAGLDHAGISSFLSKGCRIPAARLLASRSASESGQNLCSPAR